MNRKISKVENKILGTSSLVTATVLNTKIGEVDSKILDHVKYITTQKFSKLTAENFVARLKQANLVKKSDFDNKLISFNKKNTSNKKQNIWKFKKRLNSVTTNDYHFFLRRIYVKFMFLWISKRVCFSTNTCYVRIKKRQKH